MLIVYLLQQALCLCILVLTGLPQVLKPVCRVPSSPRLGGRT